jgi:hypothetical protein
LTGTRLPDMQIKGLGLVALLLVIVAALRLWLR